MAAQQRKLLEQLMSTPKDRGLRDPELCKPFCVDFCIYDLFENTKILVGKCPLKHGEKYRLQYQQGPPIPQFEDAFRSQLERVLRDCDQRIKSGLQRLKFDPNDAPPELVDLAQEIDNMTRNIALLEKEIDIVLDTPDLDSNIEKACSEAQLLNQKRAQLEKLYDRFDTLYYSSTPNAHQRLQVCRVCGSFPSALDSDKRLADHFTGKLHVGFVRVREAYDKLSN